MTVTGGDEVAVLEACQKTYGTGVGRVVVGPVDLRVRAGSYHAIVGPSGSGKTTVLSVLGALSRPSRGRALVGGVDTTQARPRALADLRASFIGFVFQQYHLLPRRSALDNVLLAFGPPPLTPPRELVARSVEALERVGMGHRLGTPAGALSGGEQQRVAIARALVKRPRLLLCDEPTGNIDDVAASSVMDLIEEALTYAAVVVVTHDQRVARRAEHRLELDAPAPTPA